jgi:nucleoid DNA-binding protein
LKKSDIVQDIANRYPTIPPYQVELIINDFLESIAVSLQRGEDVGINRFGKFVVRERGPAQRRNPRTGDVVMVPAKRGLLFHPSVVLRKSVNDTVE